MAEFQEVVNEFHRLCKFYDVNCDDCPIRTASLGTMFTCARYITEYPDEAERIIMKWVKDNPRPIYPSWYEYLTSINVVSKELPPDKALLVYDLGLLNEMSPAIAEQIGVKPKGFREEQ